ncbi:MAG: FHA domain-containing protein [bacterium]|nr:FHA domain-containing protein [bacterium]
MAIVSCNNRHFYDDSKYDTCPYCNKTNIPYRTGASASLNENVTAAYYDEPVHTSENKTVAMYDTRKVDVDDQKTIGIYSKAGGTDYVTGWIVCVKGPEEGRDYRLHHGMNKIGRSYVNDVCVAEEPEMSRECHCTIAYDDKGNDFHIVQSQGTLTYLGDTLLERPSKITTGDTFTIGGSTFEFVAFCRGERKWEKE